MFKKHLLLLLLFALIAPWAANAQETFTVYETETGSNDLIPIVGYYADGDQHNQMIYPASALATMGDGATLSQMVFYIDAWDSWYYGIEDLGTWTVKLGETTATTLNALDETTTLTEVFSDELVCNSDHTTMTIAFTSNYTYNGGNLLIDITHEAGDGYISIYFLGNDDATSASFYQYYDAYDEEWYEDSQDFLPRVTFTYEPAAQGDCEKPETLVAENVTAHEANLTWTGGSGTYNVELKAGNGDWTPIAAGTTATTLPLNQLTPETSYQARVQSVCTGTEPSGFKTVSFNTPVACVAPTNLNVAIVPGDGTRSTLSWTYTGTATTWQLCLNGDEDHLIDMDENPFTYDQFTPEETYTAKVRAYCDDIDQSTWSNTVTFTPTDAYMVTLNNGQNTNDYVPIHGSYCDYGNRSQFIIPATDLQALQWGTIEALTFYSNNAVTGSNYYNIPYFEGTVFEVYLAEVSNTVFESKTFVDWTTLNKVYDGSLVWSGKEWVFEFNNSYLYRGGNLLIGFYETSYTSSYTSINWLGVNTGTGNNTAVSQYANSSHVYGNYAVTYRTFLPKVTIEYTPGEEPSCFPPVGLTVTEKTAHTAIITWTVEEGAVYECALLEAGQQLTDEDWGPLPTNNTFTGLDNSTDYVVYMRRDCTATNSGYSDPVYYAFTTEMCDAEDMCAISITLTDAYNDGGGKIEVVDALTEEVLGTYTCSGASSSYTLNICDGRLINFVYTATDSYSYENGWVIMDADGEVISEHEGCSNNGDCDAPEEGIIATYTMNCPSCPKPTNLTATNITYTTADLSWNGSSDSYTLQYRPWYQVGDDQVTTNVLTEYTFDLSAYEGTGSIAIRHYAVSDIYRLVVDSIVVNNADGEPIFYEDFEDGTMPSSLINMDADGDGFSWSNGYFYGNNGTLDPNGNPYCEGFYACYSDSYSQIYGALTPDNWLIIPNVELGGSITLLARGSDPEWAFENFGVFVCPDAGYVEYTINFGSSWPATELTEDTPYSWQVKAICGEEETDWVSSFFLTKGHLLVFAADGWWSDVANWEDSDGNPIQDLPTYDYNVRIDADAIIPANYVAQAHKTTISGGGSITIQDGGQLKQSSATVKVTMEKDIDGYGIENVDDNAGYYFIAGPFSGVTMIGEHTWNHALNLTEGNYDFYTFDPTEAFEWRNYEKGAFNYRVNGEDTIFYMQYGEGYLYANEEDTQLEFVGSTGKSHNYSETKDYEYNAYSTDKLNGWKLVGNFFSCDAYINYVDADNNVLDADFYVMNEDGNGYDLSESSVALPPLTGAFINCSATGRIKYATEAPAQGNGDGMLNMLLTQDRGRVDQARLRFGKGFDLEHMSFRDNSKIYMPVEGKDYAVVAAESNVGAMPVNFKAEKNGTYTLSFAKKNVEFSYLHLIDNMTGTDVDLLATPSYSFEARTTDYASRFKLVFATGDNADGNFAFFSDGSFVINNEGNATLQVIDVTGRVIKSESINGCANVNVNAATGVYMLRLINGNDVKVQKVIVR